MVSNLKALLVDDHPLFLDGLTLMLRQQNIDVVTTENTLSALTVVDREKHFDIILLDLIMPGLDGYALITALHERQIYTPIIVVSASENTDSISRALKLGALGYLPKSIRTDQIEKAIESVLAGKIYIAPELNFNATQETRSGRKRAFCVNNELPKRQLDVLALTAEGYSNSEIALAMNVAEVTVKYHLQVIFRRLNVSNRTACVKQAKELGII